MGGRRTEPNSTWFRLGAAYEMPMSRIAVCGVLWRSSVPSRFSRIKAGAAPEPVTELLVDAGAMYDIDSTGAQTFLELLDELKVLRPPAFWLLFRLEALQLANCRQSSAAVNDSI